MIHKNGSKDENFIFDFWKIAEIAESKKEKKDLLKKYFEKLINKDKNIDEKIPAIKKWNYKKPNLIFGSPQIKLDDLYKNYSTLNKLDKNQWTINKDDYNLDEFFIFDHQYGFEFFDIKNFDIVDVFGSPFNRIYYNYCSFFDEKKFGSVGRYDKFIYGEGLKLYIKPPNIIKLHEELSELLSKIKNSKVFLCIKKDYEKFYKKEK